MIQGIFYSEFDNIAGPQIIFQSPQNVLKNEVFDSISGYIIIDKALCGKIITVCVQDIKIVGYPVCIEDDKYHRNALLFNIGFVFDQKTETAPFCPILRKIGSLIESMEKERGFLHQQDSKALLEIILPQILKDLTTYGECTIPVDDANILNLKLFPKLCDPIEVFEYQVPVAIRDLKHLIQNGAEWDLALQKTLPYIDGVNYVKRISLEAEVDVLIVKKCLRQLLYYGCITMMDIFLHSNIYMTTKQIAMLAKDSNLQQECMAYITKKNKKKTNGSSLSFAKIFALYCSLQPSLRMSDFCILYAESLVNIDVRRFITFGLIHSFLRRVHRYPIYMDRMKMMMMMQRSNTNIYQQKNTNTNSKSTSTGSSTTTSTTIMPSSTTNNGTTTTGTSGNGNGNDNGNENGPIVHRTSSSHQVNVSLKMGAFEKDILKMMDGQHHTDEICTTFMVRYADIEQNFMSNSISSTTCSPSNTLYCMVLK